MIKNNEVGCTGSHTIIGCLIRQLQELEEKIEFFEFSRPPILESQIFEVEQQYKIKVNTDIREILTTVGCTYYGFNDMNWDWIVESNRACREFYQDAERKAILENGFVFSDDGAGNPIIISESGEINILYHDDIEFDQLDVTIQELMQSLADRLRQSV